MGIEEHRAQSPTSVGCAVITISDTRTEATDTSGQLIRDGLEGAGHRVLSSCIVPDEPPAIRRAVEDLDIPHPASPVANRVTVSLGVATGVGEPWRDVLKRADDALYSAKKGGRNRVAAAKTSEAELGRYRTLHEFMNLSTLPSHPATARRRWGRGPGRCDWARTVFHNRRRC
ncbi:MAG: diguanylate cyclase [Nitrospinae bacterium]|nr:diguanylate cyclase [Nitrospinota bacterium]